MNMRLSHSCYLTHLSTLLPSFKKCLGVGVIGAIGFGLVACEDPPPPPPNHPPAVIGNESYALCDRREGEFALVKVSFVIEDLEGSDTLSEPYVEFNALSLPMTMEMIPAPTDEERAAAAEMAGEMMGESTELPECPVESCRARYTWEYRPSDEEAALVICPEEAPQLLVRIFDQDINGKEFYLQPQRME